MTIAPTAPTTPATSAIDASPNTAGPAALRPSYRPFLVEVASVEDISPSFRRLTLSGPELHDCGDALLDQRVTLLLGEPVVELLDPYLWHLGWAEMTPATRPPMRSYTLSGVDRSTGRVSIDLACRPAHGPASRFAQDARIGTRLIIVGPDATSPDSAVDGIAWHPGDARDVLLVGDETALPAIRNILVGLPGHVTGQVVLDLPSLADAVDLQLPAGIALDIVARDPRGVGVAAQALLADRFPQVAAPRVPAGRRTGAADEPAGEIWDEGVAASGIRGTYAWLAGESAWIAGLRRGDRALPVRGRSCSFMGYWTATP